MTLLLTFMDIDPLWNMRSWVSSLTFWRKHEKNNTLSYVVVIRILDFPAKNR